MKLAVYQSPPTDGDEASAFARIEYVLAASARAGAEMAVLPELYLPGYNRPDLHAGRAQEAGPDWTTRLADLCRDTGCGLTVGLTEWCDGKTYNAAVAFDRTGQPLAHYRKRQLFGPMERDVFTPGDDVVLFDLGGFRTALLICYDVEFAPLVRHLADKKVELLLVPTANPAGFDIVANALVPARAYECRMTIAYANYCGTENGLAFGGKSLIVGPDGEPLATAGRGEVLLVADLARCGELDDDVLSTQHLDWRPL